MSFIKKAGFSMQWLWIPLLIYPAALKIYAVLIPKGLAGFDWSLWRVALVLSVLNLVCMAVHLSDRKRHLSVMTVIGLGLTWLAFTAAWLIKLYVDWTFSWPPSDWFLKAFLSTCALPLCCGVAHVITSRN